MRPTSSTRGASSSSSSSVSVWCCCSARRRLAAAKGDDQAGTTGDGALPPDSLSKCCGETSVAGIAGGDGEGRAASPQSLQGANKRLDAWRRLLVRPRACCSALFGPITARAGMLHCHRKIVFSPDLKAPQSTPSRCVRLTRCRVQATHGLHIQQLTTHL